MTDYNPLAQDLDDILDFTQGLWDILRGERIFITGGTGFFGCWLLESFCWANDRLSLNAQAVVLTRNPQAFQEKAPRLVKHPAIQLFTGDVTSFSPPPGQFSYIIHAATESSTIVKDKSSLQMLETIIQGTRHTLDFAADHGTRNFLLISSGSIYGAQPPDLMHISEEYPGAPDPMGSSSSYGICKRTAEHLCAIYSRQFGLKTKIARCFTFIGPYLPLNAHFAVGNFIRDGLTGGPILVKGDGSPYRSYLYTADLAVWLWTILFRGSSCRPYHVGSEEEISIIELAHKVACCFRPERDVRVALQAAPGKAPERYVPSTRRAQSELGLRQNIHLEEALKRTIAWNSD